MQSNSFQGETRSLEVFPAPFVPSLRGRKDTPGR